LSSSCKARHIIARGETLQVQHQPEQDISQFSVADDAQLKKAACLLPVFDAASHTAGP